MRTQDSSRKLKLWEGLVIVLIFLAAAMGYAFLGRAQSGGTAVITADGNVIKRLSLSEDTVYCPEGYAMEFTVADGRICVSKTDCHDKVCMNTGYISGGYQTIVCLPNKITVTIEADDGNIDAVV